MRLPPWPSRSRAARCQMHRAHEHRDDDDADEFRELLGAIRVLTVFADDQATEESTASFGRPPEILGDFQLGREIGRGGLGVVYEATQIALGRRVAVKVLPPASRLDVRQMRRFEIEAQAAALLQHPNIVPIFAYGTDQGVPYFAMRLIDGQNLAEMIAERRVHGTGGLPPRDVAELGRQAAECSTMPIATRSCTGISSLRTCWSITRNVSGWPISGSPAFAVTAT